MFANDYCFPAEVAALRARKTGRFQEEVILEWIRKRDLQGVYLDVGAHIGNHALYFAAFCPSTKVIAIEGHPTIRRLLSLNLRRNLQPQEFSKVEMFHAPAWSASNVKVAFAEIPRNNAGHTHVVNSGGRKGEKPSVEERTIAIDDIPIEGRLVVFKIDVEDTEHEVVAGALRTIEKHRPVILIERHTKKQLDETLGQLRPFGYVVTAEWTGVHSFALEAR